jgi:hypothetical protein
MAAPGMAAPGMAAPGMAAPGMASASASASIVPHMTYPDSLRTYINYKHSNQIYKNSNEEVVIPNGYVTSR